MESILVLIIIGMIIDKKREIIIEILANIYFNLYPFINLKNIISPPDKIKRS
ncbi:hypothetical protein PL321_18720 [Caloramator sp. mosi_1]|uniref:hypothetical protein n=1 Tax=Caloramator sp. mosi_1 TaxID=3023090 RepID=UPI00236053F8|nr:hypothetical protein [Caloramator sp. mosi_1]WDC84230.1 hypothetical protein PL321_18720 [Caloramator sp. mosi_1]